MTVFLITAFLIVAVSVTLVVWPLRRRPAGADFSRQQLNTVIYRDQLAELERDRNAGVLSQSDYEQARAEMQRRMLEDITPEAGTAPARPAGRGLMIGLATVLPVAAVALYLIIGTPAAVDTTAHQQRFTQDDIERMVAGLADKLEKEPENYQGWLMLARSYKAMGRFPDAARAYERTGTLLDTSADLLVDYADTLAAASSGFTPKVLELIDKALKLDPANMQGLWLRGTAAFEARQYGKAIADWEALQKLLPAGSEEAGVIAANLGEARELQGKSAKAGKVGAGGTASSAAPAAAAKQSITGRVELAANLAGKVPAGATVMVVARPADGSRMPVAVLRAPASLPFAFTLDDSLSMNPANALSQYKEVLVEARISQSGQAIPQPGDLFGPAEKIRLGATKVVLKIDQVRQ